MTIKYLPLGFLLYFLVFSACGNEIEGRTTSDEIPPIISLCDLLSQPSTYAGKTVTVTVHIAPTKEGTRIWSPACRKLGLRLQVDQEAKSSREMADFFQEWNKYRPFIATLTGAYEPDYFDPIRKRRYPVFSVFAAKDITHFSKDADRGRETGAGDHRG